MERGERDSERERERDRDRETERERNNALEHSLRIICLHLK